jgi:hypothetical protein
MKKSLLRVAIPIVALFIGFVLHAPSQGPEKQKDQYLQQSRGVNSPKDIDEWRKDEKRNGLKPYPAAAPGDPNPTGGLYQFGGGGISSFAGPDLGMPFAVFRARMERQRPMVDRAAHELLESRFDLACVTDRQATMSGGKPQPLREYPAVRNDHHGDDTGTRNAVEC